jgi:hypothetical protein
MTADNKNAELRTVVRAVRPLAKRINLGRVFYLQWAAQ